MERPHKALWRFIGKIIRTNKNIQGKKESLT
jgi:hypothetical protein